MTGLASWLRKYSPKPLSLAFSSSAREADLGSHQQAGTQKGKIKTLQKRERVPTGNLSHRAPTFKQESPESVSLFQSEVLKTFVNRAGRVKKKKKKKSPKMLSYF